jgi:hypothetical protein
LKSTVTVLLAFRAIVHICPLIESQPTQLPNVEPVLGVAVRVIADPVVNGAEHVVAQPNPVGELAIVPVPFPEKFTVKVEVPLPPPLPDPPAPVVQVTFAVIEPVTRAPDESRPPTLLLV